MVPNERNRHAGIPGAGNMSDEQNKTIRLCTYPECSLVEPHHHITTSGQATGSSAMAVEIAQLQRELADFKAHLSASHDREANLHRELEIVRALPKADEVLACRCMMHRAIPPFPSYTNDPEECTACVLNHRDLEWVGACASVDTSVAFGGDPKRYMEAVFAPLLERANREARLAVEFNQRIAQLEAQLAAANAIAGRVVIEPCIVCREEYPQFSVLSGMTCPKCKNAALTAAKEREAGE